MAEILQAVSSRWKGHKFSSLLNNLYNLLKNVLESIGKYQRETGKEKTPTKEEKRDTGFLSERHLTV